MTPEQVQQAQEHRGPESAICKVCGKEIGAYESRRFGPTGAVHVWKPDGVAEMGSCFTRENCKTFPFYYTDG